MIKFKSISKKLFFINLTIFLSFIFITMIFISLFFERFYLNEKTNKNEKALKEFITGYEKAKSLDEIEEILLNSEEKNGSKITVLDENMVPKIFSFDGRDRNLRNGMLLDAIKNIGNPNMRLVRKNNNIATFIVEGREPPFKGIISMYNYEKNNEIIISVTSLQPINEALMVINKIYLYFTLIALTIVIILSYLYSKIISKPLVEMNNIAIKMANLDFEEKCDVKSEDEIGSLANSLNSLSENLNKALTSLRCANAKLEEDIEKEKRIDKMRRDFIAAVSHDLKTPISLIEGYAEALKDNIFIDKDKDFYLDIILDETKNMANLVEDMLELSKLESGKFEISKEKFNLKDLIESIIKKFKVPVQEKEIEIELNLIKDAEVFADWDRIGQVITNYLTNAIKHTEENGKIIINMIKEEDKIRVEVENTGSYIPEDEMDKIWDLFYKLDKSRNRKFKGTGVGLSIVKSIIEMHGGTYGALNTDKGVKFYFTLPLII